MDLVGAFSHIAVSFAGAWAAGRFLIGRYWRFEHPAVQTAAETAAGLFVLSHLLFTAAVFGLLRPVFFLPLFAALALLGIAGIFAAHRAPKKSAGHKPDRATVWPAVLFPALLYLGWAAACACLPPSDRDELIYHLEIPKQLLAHNGLFRFSDNIYGYFPQLGEMLFTFGLGLSGEIAAKLYSVLSGGLLALGLYGYGRSYLNVKNAALAVLIFLSAPAVMVTLPLAYVDLLFSLYAFLSLIGLLNYFRTGQLRWTVLAGIFAGACMATKYTGIQVLALLVCLSLLEHLGERRKNWLPGLLALTAAAVPVFIPYLLRNWLLTGWPLFPFHTGPFALHAGINWDPERARLYLGWLGTFGAPIGAQTLWHVVLAPVLVFITARFNDPQFYEGILGPVFLLTPFFLALDRTKKPKEIGRLILFSAQIGRASCRERV